MRRRFGVQKALDASLIRTVLPSSPKGGNRSPVQHDAGTGANPNSSPPYRSPSTTGLRGPCTVFPCGEDPVTVAHSLALSRPRASGTTRAPTLREIKNARPSLSLNRSSHALCTYRIMRTYRYAIRVTLTRVWGKLLTFEKTQRPRSPHRRPSVPLVGSHGPSGAEVAQEATTAQRTHLSSAGPLRCKRIQV